MTYEEFVKKQINDTLEYHGIKKWHGMGHTGKGVKILNLESYDGHGKDTYDVIKRVSPDAIIDWVGLGFGLSGDVLHSFKATTKDGALNVDEFADFVKGYDIITVSQSTRYGDELDNIFKGSGAVLICSAGNDGIDGVSGKFKDIGLSIGAIFIRNDGQIAKESYSAVGPEVDFACLHMHLNGTSFSAPVFAGLCGLVMDRYGKMTQNKMVEVMRSISRDAGPVGFDFSFGWGVPVLPDTIRLLESIVDGFLATNSIFNVPLIQDHITDFSGRESYPMTAKYITPHNFGSSALARDITEYVDNTDDVKSWHFTVGRDKIYQEMSILKNGWHAGDGLYGSGNRDSIGIEIEENMDSVINAVKLIVYLRKELGELEIRPHQYWSPEKPCPRWILNNMGMDAFIRLVEVMELSFKDVPESHWGYVAIEYMKDKGYMTGFPDGTFKPDDPMTRAMYAQAKYNEDKAAGKV